MAPRSAFNSSDHPVVIDGDGRQIDAGAHGPVDPTHPLVLAGVASRALVLAADRREAGEPDGQPSAEQLAAAEAANNPDAPPAGKPAPAGKTSAARSQKG